MPCCSPGAPLPMCTNQRQIVKPEAECVFVWILHDCRQQDIIHNPELQGWPDRRLQSMFGASSLRV